MPGAASPGKTYIKKVRVKMKKISWAKVNRLLMFVDNREEATEILKKKYSIQFPIWRMRSYREAVELSNYNDIIDEYATSGDKASTRKNNLLWGESCC